MRTTVIVTSATENTNLVASMVSLVEGTQKPTNICIVFDETISDNSWASARGIMGGCCGTRVLNEIITEEATILENVKHDVNFTAVKIKGKRNLTSLKNYAITKFSDSTDVFFTLNSGTVYGADLIQKYSKKLEDPIVKCVYSDYYSSGKEVYLPCFHSMINIQFEPEAIAFKNENVKFNPDNFSIITQLYTNGIISHIPEFLILK